jgi:hypothetical protein
VGSLEPPFFAALATLAVAFSRRQRSSPGVAGFREPRGNPDPCPCLRLDHRNRLPRTARTSSGSTPASTLITARPGSSIWIDPDRATAGAIPDNETLFGSAVTVTGTNLVCACRPTSRLPLRYSCRHWNTWFAFTPCSRATRAIEAPGANVASTMRRFPPVFFAAASRKGRCLNRKRIAHKAIVKQKNPAVYTAKSGRLHKLRGSRGICNSATAEYDIQTELSSRPERTRVSCHAALETNACRVFSNESRRKFANATNTNRNPRRSAVERSAVFFSSYPKF